MENIEFRKNKNKRSIQSLIEDSAIDSSYNYQAQQLRRAFNQTIIAMNAKSIEQEKQMEKMKIVIRQHEQNRKMYQNKIKSLEQDFIAKSAQYNNLSLNHQQIKKKLHYYQYKYQTINQNRNLLEPQQPSYDQQNTEKQTINKKKLKNEIYKQFNQMITKKIETFTEDMKLMTISPQVQQRIQIFLEQLIYINPYSQFQIAQQINQERKGKDRNIVKESVYTEQKDSWKLYQKSVEKLKYLNSRKRQPLPVHSRYEVQRPRERSISGTKRKRLFY